MKDRLAVENETTVAGQEYKKKKAKESQRSAKGCERGIVSEREWDKWVIGLVSVMKASVGSESRSDDTRKSGEFNTSARSGLSTINGANRPF